MSKESSEPESFESFMQEMQGVRPLQHKHKVDVTRANVDKTTVNTRRLAAETHVVVQDAGYSSMAEVPQVGPHDNMGYKRPGIQDGIYRKLRLGRFEMEARLDLHRHTLEQANSALRRFIQDCIQHDIRTVLVLPGKGDRGPSTAAVLKSHVVHWMKAEDDIQAFHTAQPRHGGAGAFYVLLRKSERSKDR